MRPSLYVMSGLPLVWRRDDAVLAEGCVGALPRQPKALTLGVGDSLLLNASGESADPAQRVLAFPEPGAPRAGPRGRAGDPGRRQARGCRRSGAPRRARVPRHPGPQVADAAALGEGHRLPGQPALPPPTRDADEVALEFALRHADGVGVSFVSTPQDVARIGERLKKAGRPDFGMVLKLETRGAIRNLAAILFEALKYDSVGLMIARGDLAVELSFERLAEMQEEILWFGEACHLPVIWATQVLDSVTHTGLPTRAEVTDAAMAMRAECVMLNKGLHIGAAVRMLADIIRKMETHQYKKRSLYRPLSVARGEP